MDLTPGKPRTTNIRTWRRGAALRGSVEHSFSHSRLLGRGQARAGRSVVRPGGSRQVVRGKKLGQDRLPLSQAGFMLIETLLAVVILAVGLTLVVRSFGSSVSALGTSADYTKAMGLLEERLWELEVKGSIAPGVLTGEFSEEDGKFRWQVDASELKDLDLCETQVTVSWERRGKTQTVSIVTYLKKE